MNCRKCAYLLSSVLLLLIVSPVDASWHWWHKTEPSTAPTHCPFSDDTHVDQNSDVLLVPVNTFDPNVKLQDQMKAGWKNETCKTVHKNAGSTTVSGQVSTKQTMSVTLGQGASASLNISTTAGAKDKAGGQIGYNPAWTSNQSEVLSSDVAVGVGVTDTNPDCDVPPNKSMMWRIDIYGKKATATMEIRYQHYCEYQRANGDYGYKPYAEQGKTMGRGSASGEKPVSVIVVWKGVE